MCSLKLPQHYRANFSTVQADFNYHLPRKPCHPSCPPPCFSSQSLLVSTSLSTSCLVTCPMSVLFACKFHEVKTISVLLTVYSLKSDSVPMHNRHLKIFVTQISGYMQIGTSNWICFQTFDFLFEICSLTSLTE